MNTDKELMKFLYKIEEKINHALNQWLESFVQFLKKITPAPVLQRIEKIFASKHIENEIEEDVQEAPDQPKAAKKVRVPKKHVARTLAWLKDFRKHIKSIGPRLLEAKAYVITLVALFGEKRKQLAQSGPMGAVKLLISGIGEKIKANLHPTVLIKEPYRFFALMAVLVGLVAGTKTYQAGLSIYRSYHPSRAPASASEIEDDEAPEYYKINRRQATFKNVNIPVYVSRSNRYVNITMQIIVQTSNRLLREYLVKYENLVYDRLNTTIQPVLPDFPITQEGKQVLTEKIQLELNQLCEDQGWEGSIEKVLIIDVFGPVLNGE